MKKEKTIYDYRNTLHKDSVTLLVVAILTSIICFILGDEDGAAIVLKSILFMIFYIIVISNKKEVRSFVGWLALITGGLMIITSLGDGSLFGIIYLFLGVFYVIHSIVFLIQLRKNYDITMIQQPKMKKSKIPLVNWILFLVYIILAKLGILPDILFMSLFAILVIYIFVSSCILIIKKYKGVLLYLTFIFSLILTISIAVIAVSIIQEKIITWEIESI